MTHPACTAMRARLDILPLDAATAQHYAARQRPRREICDNRSEAQTAEHPDPTPRSTPAAQTPSAPVT